MQRCTREDAKHVGKKNKVVGEVVVAGNGVVFAIEHHESQPAEIAAAMESSFEDIKLHNDLVGRPRFTTGTRR